jgi:hypothetical protein
MIPHDSPIGQALRAQALGCLDWNGSYSLVDTGAAGKKGIERQFNMEVDRKVSGNISKILDMM